jgi:hypothetical protein
MFDENSRYIKVVQYNVTDRRKRMVPVVGVPAPPMQTLMGYHLLKQGQRVDHLAGRYLNNAAGFWRIDYLNDAMLPEALSERAEIAIPNKK